MEDKPPRKIVVVKGTVTRNTDEYLHRKGRCGACKPLDIRVDEAKSRAGRS